MPHELCGHNLLPMLQLYKKYQDTIRVYAIYLGLLVFALACSLNLI